jgi:hypothetical protein
MVRLQVEYGACGLPIHRVAANIRNRQSRAAYKYWSSSSEIRLALNNHSQQENQHVTKRYNLNTDTPVGCLPSNIRHFPTKLVHIFHYRKPWCGAKMIICIYSSGILTTDRQTNQITN